MIKTTTTNDEHRPIDEEDSGEEVDLNSGSVLGRQSAGTTTVTMFEPNDDSQPMDGQGE